MDEITQSTQIKDLDVTIRTKKCLASIQVHTVADLLPIPETDLRKVPNLGKKTLREIKEIIDAAEPYEPNMSSENTDLTGEQNPAFSIYLDELDLSERAKNCTKNAQILTVGDLLTTPIFQLKQIQQLGKKTLEELTTLRDEYKNSYPRSKTIESKPIIRTYTTLIEQLLKPKDVEIFKQRNGLDDGQFMTLEEVGNLHGITRERVRQILNRSIKKIRNAGIRRSYLPNSPSATLNCFLNSILIESPVQIAQYCPYKIVEIINNQLSYMPTTEAFKLLEGLLQFKIEATTRERISDELRVIRELDKRNRRLQRKLQRRSNRFYKQISATYWPERISQHSVEDLGSLYPLRPVANNVRTGEFYSDKMLRYVEYESRLEYLFFQKLENSDEVAYYMEQPVAVDYYFENRNRKYYPDILVLLASGKALIVEIKPKEFMSAKKNIAKWKSLKQYCIKNGYGMLVTQGTKGMNFEQLDEL